jgi:transcriptional regulator
MYKLSYFTENDHEAVIAFMKQHSFAVITAIGEQYPVATQVPLFIDVNEEGKIILSGHIMRKTDHHRAFEKNENVLVLFTGPHTYISASWYTNPQSASTWNYMTVQAKGKITLLDEAATYQAIKNITDHYEGQETAAAFNKMEDEYIAAMLKAIVAFSIEVETLDNVFKLSQNKDEQNKKQIIAALQQRKDENSKMIAEEMMRRL